MPMLAGGSRHLQAIAVLWITLFIITITTATVGANIASHPLYDFALVALAVGTILSAQVALYRGMVLDLRATAAATDRWAAATVDLAQAVERSDVDRDKLVAGLLDRVEGQAAEQRARLDGAMRWVFRRLSG